MEAPVGEVREAEEGHNHLLHQPRRRVDGVTHRRELAAGGRADGAAEGAPTSDAQARDGRERRRVALCARRAPLAGGRRRGAVGGGVVGARAVEELHEEERRAHLIRVR